MYFLWEIKIPLLERRTSILKKYFSPSKFFISNSLNNLFLSCAISSISLSVMIMSSTYIIRHVIKYLFLFKNKIWLELLYFMPVPFHDHYKPPKPGTWRLLKPIECLFQFVDFMEVFREPWRSFHVHFFFQIPM